MSQNYTTTSSVVNLSRTRNQQVFLFLMFFSMDVISDYNPEDAAGFIRINALRCDFPNLPGFKLFSGNL